jgi:hypothetical protein
MYFKIILLIITLTVNLSANLTLKQNEYRFNLLNHKLKFNNFDVSVYKELPVISNNCLANDSTISKSRIYTMKEIFNLIDTQFGYTTFIKIDELDLDKRFVDLEKYENIGDMLRYVLQGVEGVIDIDESKHALNIVYPKHLYIDLPYDWNIKEAKRNFERSYPNVRFYIAGNRISAYGLDRDVNKVALPLKRYQSLAHTQAQFRISVYPYCTSDNGNSFIAKRKLYGSEQLKPYKIVESVVGSGGYLNINYKDISLSMKVDLQNGRLIYNNQTIPLNELNVLGFAFKDSKEVDNSNSILDYFRTKEKRCSHFIITIDNMR